MKNRKMQELILSLLSLIILVPIIYFLPLGLSNKGKIIIIAASFLLANVGLLTQDILPLWLIWAILGLLVFLLTYILQNRMSDVLFAGISEESGSKESVYEQNFGSADEMDSLYHRYDTHRAESAAVVRAMENTSTDRISEVEASPSTVSGEHPREESSETEEFVSGEEEFVLKESNERLDTEESETVEDPEHALAEKPEDEPLLEPDDGEKEDTSADEPSFLGKIEKLLEDDVSEEGETIEQPALHDHEDSPESNLEELSTEDLSEAVIFPEKQEKEETHDLSGELFGLVDEFVPDEDLESETLPENEDAEEDIRLTVESEFFPAEDEVQDSKDGQQAIEEMAGIYVLPEEEGELQATALDLFGETVPPVEPEQIHDLLADKEKEPETIIDMQREKGLHDDPAKEVFPQQLPTEDFELQAEDEDLADLSEEQRALRQQMLRLLASQLELQRDKLSADRYESLIKEHLIADLPPQDYYTFASMLVEHYIRNKESGKLEELLCDLREKFKEFPIISMEIQYLYEQYC